MANVKETPVWEPGVYQIEYTDKVRGGEDGISNVQGKQLANRTAYLKKRADQVDEAKGTHATLPERLDHIEGEFEAVGPDKQNAGDSALMFALEQAGIANREVERLRAGESKTSALPALAAWNFEQQAEVLRGQGQSGLFLTRQYNRGGDDAYDRGWAENYNPASIHNHPNYRGMPGMGEFSAIINGYYLRTRHNDYRLRGPAPEGTAFLATEEVEAPAVPALVTGAGSVANQITAMRDLFRRYAAGEWPQGFGWTLSYVECWFEVLTGTVTDTYSSFRHQQYVTTVDAALREVLKFNAGGYKNPSENVSFEPPVVRFIDASGNPVLARLRYRLAAVDVSSLGDLRPHIQIVDDWAQAAYAARQSGRYRVPDDASKPGMLDQIMGLVPGLNGAGAVLEEKYGTVVIGKFGDQVPLNAAYYNRFSAGQTDASNRSNFRRGFNDPTLFVAKNTRAEVAPMTIGSEIYRFSYAIPLELILRTPLENWNPYNVPEAEKRTDVTGNGLQATPYSAWHPDARNFRTPSAFYGSTLSLTLTDQADTGSGGAYVQTPSGGVQQMRGSGIYLALPAIPGVAATIRLRHPVFPVYHEGSHAQSQFEALRGEVEVVRGLASLAVDQAGQAHHGLRLLREHAQQEGELTITNRGVVSGCTVTRSEGAARNLNLAGGLCFANGRTYRVATAGNAASVPSNIGTGSVTLYAYLFMAAGGNWRLAVTPIGTSVPSGAIPVYSLTLPANSTDETDPGLTKVTITDIRRLEPGFPNVLDSPASASAVLNRLNANDYRLIFDVVSADGAPCDVQDISVISRATNGFTMLLGSAADNVVIRWKASKLNQ